MAGSSGHPPRERRATWLVLATDGPAIQLDRLAPASEHVRIVADPDAFSHLLTADHPRIAVLAEPPAGEPVLGLVRRERQRRRHALRTVHLSPVASVSRRIAALRVGFDEALPQTVDADELAQRIAYHAEQAQSRPDAHLVVAAGYELDLVAHELRLDGAAVHLRPKEFQLLATLAANPGRAFTRRQLLDRVWGHDQVGDQRTVDVHVRWIRSKIEPQPDRPVHLVTVRGIGYRLDPPLTEP